MKLKQLVTAFGTVASGFLFMSAASATVIDFDSAPASVYRTGDYVEDGFRISRLDGH